MRYQSGEDRGDAAVRRLIWIYFFLLIFEGSVRKWILPGLSNAFLLVRDPVVLMIYILAGHARRFPKDNIVVQMTVTLGVFTMLFSGFSDLWDYRVVLYGLRINFFHIPLMLVIPEYFTRRDVVRMGKWVLLFSFPIFLLMTQQFGASGNDPLNVGAGGTPDAQLQGTMGKIRPSSVFTFITGPALYFPMVTAFAMAGMTMKRLYPPLLIVIGVVATLLAIPISISRLLALSVALVAVVWLVCVLFVPQLRVWRYGAMKWLMMLAVIAAGVTSLAIFKEGSIVFSARWAESTDQGGGFYTTVVERTLAVYLEPLKTLWDVSLFGRGIGSGSNVGAVIYSGHVGFDVAEGEWGKIIGELGPFLGLAYIALRIRLFLMLLSAGRRGLRQGDVLPSLLAAASGLVVLSGQWGPPTIQGFATLGAGLTIAASRISLPVSDVEDEPEHLENEGRQTAALQV